MRQAMKTPVQRRPKKTRTKTNKREGKLRVALKGTMTNKVQMKEVGRRRN